MSPRARSGLAVLGKLALAYVLLATFWASSGMRPDAFAWIAPGAGAWLAAPALLGSVGLGGGVAALWDLAHAVLGGADYWRDYVFVSVIGGVIAPLALTRAIGPRRLEDIGLRRPGRSSSELAIAACAAMLPLSIVVALHPAFREGLREALGRSPWFALAIPVGTCAEHFFLHGVLLAWLHPSGAWPSSSELDRPLVWPGKRVALGARAGLREALASLAIPRSCWLPCVLSGPLFWAIHVGKPDAELWLSLPAGGVFAWLAYRADGWLVPLLVHVSVPATAALIALATFA